MRVSTAARHPIRATNLPRGPALNGQVGGAAGWWPWLVRLTIALLTILWLLGVVWVVPVC